MRKKRRALFLILAILIGWFILYNQGKDEAQTQELIFASLIYFLCFLPLVIYFLSGEENIPYVPIFGLFYFIYFGLSIFTKYDLFSKSYLSSIFLVKCLSMAMWGFILFIVSFYFISPKLIGPLVKPLKLPLDPKKAYRFSIFLGFIGISIDYIALTQRLPAFVSSGVASFLSGLSRLSIAILYLLNLRQALKFNGKIFFWCGIFIPKLLLDLITGSTLHLILDFAILIFLDFYHYGRIPWKKAVLALVFFVLIFSVRDDYRGLTWYYGEHRNASPTQKVRLYFKLISDKLTGRQERQADVYEALAARTDYLVTFAKVVELTPSLVPFWGGYSYSTLVTSLLPRMIFPDKPVKNVGQEFGHRYSFLTAEDLSTSYNLPLLLEMYVNFGELGVWLGMFILGLIFRFLYSLLNHPKAGEGGILISTVIFVNLLNVESDFSLVFGSTLQYILLFYIVIRRMKLRQPRLDE